MVNGEEVYEKKLDPNSQQSAGNKSIKEIRSHVLQLEGLLLAFILFQALVFLQQPIANVLGESLSYLLPLAFLSLTPIFVRVNNPKYTVRTVLKWGISGLGTGAAIGGATTGVLTGGLGTPAGALIGAPVGFVVGAIIGPYGLEEEPLPEVLTQGEAIEFLIEQRRKKFPQLDMKIIMSATDYSPPYKDDSEEYGCRVYMFLSDGVIKCAKEDLLRWLSSECWRKKAISASSASDTQLQE